jgi:hypothetical protein
MMVHRLSGLAVILAIACQTQESDLGPSGPDPSVLGLSSKVVESASGGYHFTSDPRFFGVPVDNRVSFSVARHEDGSVSGRFNYEQGVLGERFNFKGSLTCFRIYDTPVLQDWPDIPAMTGNRAKWGGIIEKSNDPTIPVGSFIWFQSIAPRSEHPVGLRRRGSERGFLRGLDGPEPALRAAPGPGEHPGPPIAGPLS